MAVARGYTAAYLAIELDGVSAGYARSLAGGEPFAEVVQGSTNGAAVDKHLGAVSYEPITIDVTTSVGGEVFDWVTAALQGSAKPINGAIGFLDHNWREQERLEWTDGVLTTIAFPAADAAAAKDPAVFRLTVAPLSARLLPGRNTSATTGLGKRSSAALATNFRWSIAGLEAACTRTVRVGSIVVRPMPGGAVEIDDVEFIVSNNQVDAIRTWVTGLLKGNDDERTATLTFLDAALKHEVLRIDLAGVAAFRLAEATTSATGSSAGSMPRITVSAYAERVDLTRAKAGDGAPAARSSSAGDGGGADVDRDADGTQSERSVRPPARLRTVEEVAERLLAAPPPVPVGSFAAGRAAGQAWASEIASIQELASVAALAGTDDWSALLLPDGHSLAGFLADEGVIGDGDQPAQVGRDEFVTGLVAGASDVHLKVTPLLKSAETRADAGTTAATGADAGPEAGTEVKPAG